MVLEWTWLLTQFICVGAGWGGAGSRHKSYLQWSGGRQDVRQDPLHCSKYIVSLIHEQRYLQILLWVYESIAFLQSFSFLVCKTPPLLVISYITQNALQFRLSFSDSSLSLCSCCGAGTAADTEKTTELVSSNLTIFSLNSGRNPRVVMAVNILQDMLYRFVVHTHMYLCLEVCEWVQLNSQWIRKPWCSPGFLCFDLCGPQVSRPNWCQSYTGRSRLHW